MDLGVLGGVVYAVEFSHRSGRDLTNMAKRRPNVVPIVEDARQPQRYRPLEMSWDILGYLGAPVRGCPAYWDIPILQYPIYSMLLSIHDRKIELTLRLRLSQPSVHFKPLWPMVQWSSSGQLLAAVCWRHVDWHGRCDFLRRGSA